MQDYQITRLDNGLTIATDPISSVESVTIGVWCKTGSRYETPEQNGVAHYFEHMVFKGTKTKSAKDIAETLENVGGDMNAYTGREMTAFYARVLKEHLPVALDLIADILINPSFPEEEMEKERGVILQEIGMYHDSPDDHVYTIFQQAIFGNHALGAPIIGTEQTVKSFKTADIQHFLREYYHPQNMILCCSGNVDHDRLVNDVEHLFKNLPQKPQNTAPHSFTGNHHQIVVEDRSTLEQTHVLLGFKGLGYRETKKTAALKIAANILGGGMSSRLFQEIREERGLAYAVYGFSQAYQETGIVGFYAGTAHDKVSELVPVMYDHIRHLDSTLLDSEIDRVKAQMKSRSLMSLESTYSRCDRLGRGMIQFPKPRTIHDLMDELNSITKEDIISVCQSVFTHPPSIAAIGKQSELPDFKTLLA